MRTRELFTGPLLRLKLAALALLCCAAAPASAAVLSTGSIHCSAHAAEFLSQRMDQSTAKYMQDYIYTGAQSSRGLSVRQPVYRDAVAAPAPVAAYTAKASAARALPGKVPALTVSLDGLAAKTAAPPEAAKSVKAGKKGPLRQAAAWIAGLVKAVGDWLAGAATWVHDKLLGKGRSLTDEETAELRQVFGDSVDYSKVRIVTGSNMGLWGRILTSGGAAVTWGNTIYFPNAGGESRYSFQEKSGWLVHEMTHNYQYQKYGPGYIVKSVWGQLTKGDSFYEYELTPGKKFRDYNVEQQAELTEHYYQIRNGSRSATPEERAIYEQIMAGQGLF